MFLSVETVVRCFSGAGDGNDVVVSLMSDEDEDVFGYIPMVFLQNVKKLLPYGEDVYITGVKRFSALEYTNMLNARACVCNNHYIEVVVVHGDECDTSYAINPSCPLFRGRVIVAITAVYQDAGQYIQTYVDYRRIIDAVTAQDLLLAWASWKLAFSRELGYIAGDIILADFSDEGMAVASDVVRHLNDVFNMVAVNNDGVNACLAVVLPNLVNEG
jgi:hypothetical protein